MALDDTVAGAASNSYLSVVSADAIADTYLLGKSAKTWDEATDEMKESALRRATIDIDVYVGQTIPYSTTQALRFPRVVDIDAVTSVPKLPYRLDYATFLQALHLLRNADLLDDAQSYRARGLSSFANPDGTGGSVERDANVGRLDPAVIAVLQPYSQGAVIATIVTT